MFMFQWRSACKSIWARDGKEGDKLGGCSKHRRFTMKVSTFFSLQFVIVKKTLTILILDTWLRCTITYRICITDQFELVMEEMDTN